MKRNYFLFLFLLFLSASCKDKEEQSSGTAENSIDAARDFIRAALDGKFREARTYMLTDSVNTNYMDVAERSYEKADQSVKDGYRTSTIHIHKTAPLNDSTAIVIFSNSFKNDHDTLRLVKLGQYWLVDLKYLYEHDTDTIRHSVITNDTIQ